MYIGLNRIASVGFSRIRLGSYSILHARKPRGKKQNGNFFLGWGIPNAGRKPALYLAAQGLHLAVQGLYLAVQGLHLAAQALYLAAQGLYLAVQGLHLAAQGLYLAVQLRTYIYIYIYTHTSQHTI